MNVVNDFRFAFPHLHMMALALALDQLPCSLLLLTDLDIVDSLVWASVSQPSLLVCVMEKQSSQTTTNVLCKPAVSYLLASMFTKQSMTLGM